MKESIVEIKIDRDKMNTNTIVEDISLLRRKLIRSICRKRIRQWHDYRSQSTADGFRKNLFRIDASGFALSAR